jgi:ferredoxin
VQVPDQPRVGPGGCGGVGPVAAIQGDQGAGTHGDYLEGAQVTVIAERAGFGDVAVGAVQVGDGLHMERFTISRTDKGGGEGGTVTFAISDKSIELDGATSLLDGGEKLGIQMPFGCRMGTCQSCVLPLESGHVREFRSGTEHGAGDRIQTCISAASGDCTITI